jgi:hypothetical protein
MLQYTEGFRNVGSLQVDVALMHLEGAVAGRKHGRLCRDSSSRPLGFCTMAQIMKPKVLHFRISACAFQCASDGVLRDRLTVVPSEDQTMYASNL